MALFTEPFEWLKPVGSWIDSAKKAIEPINDWNALGSVGYRGPDSDSPLGELTYNQPNRRAIEERQFSPASNNTRVDPRDNIARILQLNGANQGNAPMNPFNGGATRQGMDDAMDTPEDPLAELKARRAELESLLDAEYSDTGEYNGQIDAAYAGALANINKARDQANSNYKESDRNIADLTAGHVNEIATKDRQSVQANGAQLQNSYGSLYDNTGKGLAADRDAELKSKTEMLQRLGIQEAGIGDAGQVQTEAITRNTQDKGMAMQQAQGYQAADLTRNTEQAQSQASAGVERRSALNRDLQNILGKVDNSEAEVQGQIAQAKLQGSQASKNDWMQQQRFNLDSLAQIDSSLQDKTDSDRSYSLELQKLNQKGQGAGGVFNAVGDSLTREGIDPAPYLDAYSSVAASTPFNSQVDGDKALWTIRQMKKKNPSLSNDYIARVVMGIENYGTDKLK